jgi:hypothetical protein
MQMLATQPRHLHGILRCGIAALQQLLSAMVVIGFYTL